MVAGDPAVPIISFESSANSVVLLVVIAGMSLINKRNSRGPRQNPEALQIVLVPMWIIYRLHGLPLELPVLKLNY